MPAETEKSIKELTDEELEDAITSATADVASSRTTVRQLEADKNYPSLLNTRPEHKLNERKLALLWDEKTKRQIDKGEIVRKENYDPIGISKHNVKITPKKR